MRVRVNARATGGSFRAVKLGRRSGYISLLKKKRTQIHLDSDTGNYRLPTMVHTNTHMPVLSSPFPCVVDNTVRVAWLTRAQFYSASKICVIRLCVFQTAILKKIVFSDFFSLVRRFFSSNSVLNYICCSDPFRSVRLPGLNNIRGELLDKHV